MAVKKDKKAEEDRIATAFFMLAKVIDQNTTMFKAFIDMISAKEEEERKAPLKQETPSSNISKDQIKDVLIQINKTCGTEKARKFLDSFDAKSISEVAPASYDIFMKSGTYMVNHHKGDVI
tara:strand:+ start:936 stop:1298 length:363 start_codon:yes stop_codon:yes gene_type:complete